MSNSTKIRDTLCPFCGSCEFTFWASEQGFEVSRCLKCRILLLNPMPDKETVALAVANGVHTIGGMTLNVRSRRIPKKVTLYQNYFIRRFNEIWLTGQPVTWLDIGCGYGEALEALTNLAPFGSSVVGIEPMRYKADAARARGLQVIDGYIEPFTFSANIISMIDIYSHIWDFRLLLKVVSTNIVPGGHIFIETGNLADLDHRDEFYGDLGLPDHMVFGGEKHIVNNLTEAGFKVVSIDYVRADTILESLKNVIKWMMGKPTRLGIPYRSRYRSLRILAKRISV